MEKVSVMYQNNIKKPCNHLICKAFLFLSTRSGTNKIKIYYPDKFII